MLRNFDFLFINLHWVPLARDPFVFLTIPVLVVFCMYENLSKIHQQSHMKAIKSTWSKLDNVKYLFMQIQKRITQLDVDDMRIEYKWISIWWRKPSKRHYTFIVCEKKIRWAMSTRPLNPFNEHSNSLRSHS